MAAGQPAVLLIRRIPTILNPYTHEEPCTNGDHFIVKTPNPDFAGVRLGVQFGGGVGRTRSLPKAKRFDEEFGYVVTRPPSVEPWNLVAENPMRNRAEEYQRENSTPVVVEID
jgi:hypothetical protein